MVENTRAQLLADLETSHAQLAALLESVGDAPDWRPGLGEWSFREIAAHLAAAEMECFQGRVERVSTGERPHFEYYDNTGRDFSRSSLPGSLEAWAEARRALLAFTRALPEECWAYTGTHATFGVLTLAGVLQVVLDHDREHLAELRVAIEKFRDSARGAGA